MDARGLTYAVALGASTAAIYTVWRAATSPLLALVAGGYLAMRALDAVLPRSSEQPPEAWVDLAEGLRAAYERGAERARTS